jgi:hypothetical protein
MSQDIYPNGTGITISGSLATTSSISTPGNLTATGVVSLGSDENLISLNSKTRLNGPILDTNGLLGGLNQILLSDSTGVLRWQNYEAGLTYEGTWDAANNTTNGDNNSPALVSGVGISGHFYIVNVAGSTNLNGNSSWNVGDWAVFLDEGGQPASWQKIDNTSVLTGDGTAGVFAKWTDTTTLNDSLMSQVGTNVIINGGLKVKDTVEATTTNSNLKLKGDGIGGVEIMSADGITDGKIQLNCSQNSHGVTLQSPPHASGATYTLVLPTSFGGAGDVLTSTGVNPSQLIWTTPTTGTVTNFTAVSTAIPGITTTVTNPTTAPELTLSITGTPGAGLFLDGTGNWSSPGGGVTDITATAPLNASVATGSVVLSMPAYATTTGGYVPSGGASGQYLDGLSGNWTSIPASGVTSVTGDTTTIAATTGITPVISAITTGGVGPTSTSLATGAQIQTAIDLALAGTLTFKGTFDANTGTINSGINNGLQLYTGFTGGVAIAEGDFYIANVSGLFYGVAQLNVGDEAIALFSRASGNSTVSDWSVVPTQVGVVTGSGANAQVTFWDGTSNVDGDTAFNWDNINKRLGIGTNAPTASLEIENNNQAVQLKLKSTFDASYIQFTDPTNPSDGLFVGRDGGSDSFDILVYPASDPTIIPTARFTQFGQIGVNNGSPLYAIDVRNSNINSVLDTVVNIESDNTAQSIKIGASAQMAFPQAPNYINSSSNFGGAPLQLQINGTNIMHVDYDTMFGSPRIGINTATPSISFEINTTDAIKIPAGNTAQRPGIFEVSNGMLRYNSDELEFEGYSDGAWGAIGGADGASTITTNNFSGNGTVGPFTLGAAPSGGSTSFVDVFIDGVYQEIATYTVSGTSLSFVVGSEPPAGTNIQTKTTSGAVSGALVSSVDIGQSSGNTGAVNLRVVPLEVTSGQTILGNANSLYIFTSTTGSVATVNLPASPTSGDSIKISNLGGLANVLGANGNKIMGVAADLTINTPTAAFELIWSGSNNGWIIIGNV